jgi:hypothetical protein
MCGRYQRRGDKQKIAEAFYEKAVWMRSILARTSTALLAQSNPSSG